MKKKLFSTILILFVLLSVGCGKKKKDDELKMDGKENGVSYEIYQDFKEDTRYRERGYYINTLNEPNSPYWYMITMGEMPTAGYSIEIIDIKIDKDKNVTIVVQEQSLGEGEMAADVLTYPTCAVKLENANDVRIIDNNGYVYQYIERSE